jgi:hypothetical protein
MTAAVEPYPPGVHNLTDDEYFGPALSSTTLSSTGIRELLICPAKFRHNQQHPRPPKRTFDVGHAAHQLALGAGPPLVRIEADEWRSKAIKEEVAEVRAAGGVPLKPADWDTVHGMALALREHRMASRLFRDGKPERTLLWRDDETGVDCRAKADWLDPDGIVDYKTCDNASPEALRKSVWNYGYYLQAAFYLRGFRATDRTGFARAPFFVFVAQEKDAPYLVTVFQLGDEALAYGDRKCAEALQVYRDCTAAGQWPGYSDAIEDIDLPGWVRTEEW